MAPKKWTVAGAARYARDARHDTAAHMATAPIARQWRKSKMLRAFQVHATNLRDRQAASVMLFGGIGYRPPYPDGWDAAADLVTSDESRYLGAAELYVITPQMCDVVIAAAQSLTVDDLKLISEDDLPSPTGLLVLPAPLLVRSFGGDLGDDRALCRHTPAAFMIPDHGRPDGVHAKPAVRISRNHDAHGPVRPDSFVQFAAQARQEGTPLPPLLLDSIRCLPLPPSKPTATPADDSPVQHRPWTARIAELPNSPTSSKTGSSANTSAATPSTTSTTHSPPDSCMRSGGSASSGSPTSSRSKPTTPPTSRRRRAACPRRSASFDCANAPSTSAGSRPARTGSIAGSSACIRCDSGIPANNATRSSTEGPTSDLLTALLACLAAPRSVGGQGSPRRSSRGVGAVEQDSAGLRDVAALVVARIGSVRPTGDATVPWTVVDGAGVRVGPVSEFLRDLLACGSSPASCRSYGYDLLRWFGFLAAVGVGWNRAQRAEVRDFVLWLRTCHNPARVRRRPDGPVPGSVNPLALFVSSGAEYS